MRDDSMTDEQLLRSCLDGDVEEYHEIVERYRTKALAIAMNILRNREDAEDASQDAFIQVYKNLGKFDFQRSFPNWFYSILYKRCLDRLRKRRRFAHFYQKIKAISFCFYRRLFFDYTLCSSEQAKVWECVISCINKCCIVKPEDLTSGIRRIIIVLYKKPTSTISTDKNFVVLLQKNNACAMNKFSDTITTLKTYEIIQDIIPIPATAGDASKGIANVKEEGPDWEYYGVTFNVDLLNGEDHSVDVTFEIEPDIEKNNFHHNLLRCFVSFSNLGKHYFKILFRVANN